MHALLTGSGWLKLDAVRTRTRAAVGASGSQQRFRSYGAETIGIVSCRRGPRSNDSMMEQTDPMRARAEAELRRALEIHQAGRLKDAEAIYREVLGFQPTPPDALHLLGVVSHQLGDHQAAIEQIQRAIDLAPGNPACHNNLGTALRSAGNPPAAETAYRAALSLRPDNPHRSFRAHWGWRYQTSLPIHCADVSVLQSPAARPWQTRREHD